MIYTKMQIMANNAVQALHESLGARFLALEAQINGHGNPFLKAKRQEAFQAFQQLDFPTTKHEEWKYTNIRKALGAAYALDVPSTVSPADWAQFHVMGLDAHLVVFVDGKFSPENSSFQNGGGLQIAPLAEVAQHRPEFVETHFGQHIRSGNDIFTALNTAFSHEGLVISVEKGKVIEQPIFILHVTDTRKAAVFAQPRILVVVGEHAQASIIEDHAALGNEPSFTNLLAEIVVEKNAVLHHYKLQNKGTDNYSVNTTEVDQADNSHYHNTTITLGGGIVRNNLHIALNGEHIEAFMTGLYLVKDKDHVDNHTLVDHRQPNCYSNELYKGILDGHSTGVFNGKIYVQQYAQKTNAYQSNKNVLLSPTASVNTKPQLEIWADDVKCSHGATTGALDEEPLFYLRSRGIPLDQAKAMLMHAFAADVLDRIKIEAFRKHVEQLIEERLS